MDANKQAVDIHYSQIHTLVNIEYPGKIVNPEKALKTLGGTEQLKKVYTSPESRLQLRYRPNDIYCKSAYGTCYPTNSVLLNVKQKRNKKTGATKLSVELIGVISTTYKFNSMMDFQYLTMQREGDKYKSLKGLCTIESLVSSAWMDNGAPLHFMPQIFSSIDVPYSYHFKDEDRKPSEDLKSGSLFATARKKRSNHNQTVSYDGEVPTHPLPGAEVKIHTEYLRKKLEEFRELFSKRPIWTRAALSSVTNLNNNRLKTILPLIAYNSISGPWRTMWIRHGYDPKQHPEAKHLQLIDYRYRARDRADIDRKVVLHKRSYSKYLPNFSKARPKVIASDQLEYLTKGDEEEEQVDEMGEEERKIQYMFWPGIIPPYRQLFYQICDIQLKEVEDIVNANNFKEPPCDKNHGFLAPNACNEIRSWINKYVVKTLKEKQGELGADDEGGEYESETDDFYNSALETYR